MAVHRFVVHVYVLHPLLISLVGPSVAVPLLIEAKDGADGVAPCGRWVWPRTGQTVLHPVADGCGQGRGRRCYTLPRQVCVKWNEGLWIQEAGLFGWQGVLPSARLAWKTDKKVQKVS